MAGKILFAYSLVIYGCQFLNGGDRWSTQAIPAGTAGVTTAVEVNSGNGHLDRNANPPSKDIWQITETAGNQKVQETPGTDLRTGWTAPEENDLETMEGWINSGIIAKDSLVPYKAIGVWDRNGNRSEEWKKELTDPRKERRHNGSVWRIRFNERRKSPLQFYWQINLSKRIHSSARPHSKHN